MSSNARTPPRFVPTLTAVVDDPLAAPLPALLDELPAVSPPRVPAPPRPAPPPGPGALPAPPFVAAATLVAASPPVMASAPARQAQVALPPGTEDESFLLEEQLLHRVLQRIDLSLEERLTDTVSAAVQRQLDAMVPELRVQIERALRTLVSEALAQELAENPGSAPSAGPLTFG